MKDIIERILRLYEIDLDDVENAPMRIDSLMSFFEYATGTDYSRDKFTLNSSPNGTIVIGWKKSKFDLFNIEFISPNENYYVRFIPKDDGKIIKSGGVTVKEVIKIANDIEKE